MMDETSKPESSLTIQDIRSKDVAYQDHLGSVRKWESASELDKQNNTDTSGPRPEPNQAAKRGQEFSALRDEVTKEFEKQMSKVLSEKPNSFDKLPSIIDKTENPTDKIVKMATYLDLVSTYVPEISIPNSADALKRCPEALELTSKFKDRMVNIISRIQPTFLRGRSGLVDEVSSIVLPFADSTRRSEIIEVTGEALGNRLYDSLMNSPTRTVDLANVVPVLSQQGIIINQNEATQNGDQHLDYDRLQNLLVDEAAKMPDGDARNKSLGVAIGIMSRVAEGLLQGSNRQNEPRLLEIMTAVTNTIGKVDNLPNLPDFFRQKLVRIRSDMQVKRNSW